MPLLHWETLLIFIIFIYYYAIAAFIVWIQGSFYIVRLLCTILNPAGMALLFVRAFSANIAVARVANASGFLRNTNGGITWVDLESTAPHSVVAASSPTRAWVDNRNLLAPICFPENLSSYAGLPLAARS